MKIAYGDVEAVVRAIHGSGARPTALLGRIKHLRRLNWPATLIGRSRNGYDLSQLIGLLLAFELFELGLAPLRAVRLMRASWDEALQAVVIGWAAAKGEARPVLLGLSPSALADTDADQDDGSSTPDRLMGMDREAVLTWLDGDSRQGSSALYVIDPRRLATSAASELLALGLMSEDDMHTAFLDLGTELFGYREPAVWFVSRRFGRRSD